MKRINSESEDIAQFLTSIHQSFDSLKNDEDHCHERHDSLCLHFLQEIRLLLLFLGRITSLEESVVKEGCRDTSSPAGQYLLLFLMTWKQSIRISFLVWNQAMISCHSMELSFCSSETSCSSGLLMSSSSPMTNVGNSNNLMSHGTDQGNQMSPSVASLMTSFPLEVTAIFLADLMTFSLMRFDAGRLIMMTASNILVSDKEWTHLSPFPSSLMFSNCLKSVRDALVMSSLKSRNNPLTLQSCSSFWSLFLSLCSNRPNSRNVAKLEDIIFGAGPLFVAKNDSLTRSSSTGVNIIDDNLLSSLWLMYSFNREIQTQSHKSTDRDMEDLLTKQDPFPSAFVVELVKKIIARDGSSITSCLNNLILSASLTRLYLDSHFIEGNTADMIFPFLDLLIKKLNGIDDLPSSFVVPKNGHEWSSWISSASYVSSSGANNHASGRGLYASLLLLLESFVKNCIVGCNRKNAAASTLAMMTTSVTEGDLLDKSAQVQRFKSRLYSKIQDKRIEDLSDIGLFKFLTIFLSFSSWTSTVSVERSDTPSSSISSWMEMSDKVCEITQKILDRREHHRTKVSSCLGDARNAGGTGKTAVSFKALFALLYLMPTSPSITNDPNNSSSAGNPCNSLPVSSCDSSKVRKLLIRQIPLLSASESRHPLAVSSYYVYDTFFSAKSKTRTTRLSLEKKEGVEKRLLVTLVSIL